MITRTIDRNFANMRLDRFLRKAFPEESLSVFFAVIRKKKVRVNGVVGKANQMLVEGDVVNIYENFKSVSEDDKKGESLPLASAAEAAPATPSSGDTPQRPDAKSATGFAKNKSTWGRHLTGAEKQAHWGAHELDLVVQTEDYVIVNKPSGLASQPGSGTRPGESLVEYLWEWGRNEGLDFKPTIAHRLDQETSGLIIAGDVEGDTIDLMTATTDQGDFGLLFTDMDEYTKMVPDFKVEPHDHSFETYLGFLKESDLAGFILNIKSEAMILPRDILDEMDNVPNYDFPSDNSYTPSELKTLKDSINNTELEEFISDPSNIGDYDGLFKRISDSTLLTLRLSREDLKDMVKDGVISMIETGPLGFLHSDKIGGNYATVFTSQEKISHVDTPYNKYIQIVNFSQMTNCLLNDDMDGIIINPNCENILITRNVLLEYSDVLEVICYDEKLNSAVFHMFPMEM